jgi:transcriptional regulator with XRE-family HTH domain
MNSDFALDLKVQRRKAGLSQRDVAHLLGAHPTKVSLLETGRLSPNLTDLALLSLVFGKTMEEYFVPFVKAAREALLHALPSMPDAPKRWLSRFNRQYTLDQLADRLQALGDGV